MYLSEVIGMRVVNMYMSDIEPGEQLCVMTKGKEILPRQLSEERTREIRPEFRGVLVRLFTVPSSEWNSIYDPHQQSLRESSELLTVSHHHSPV